MKRTIEFMGFVGLIMAGLASAVESFLNPGPAGNTVIQAGGGATTITWTKDPSQPIISMVLKNDQQSMVLINQEPNTGTFIWDVPENLPMGMYTLEIGAGPPDDLAGSSSSASFVVQPCGTCSAVPSTVILPPVSSETELANTFGASNSTITEATTVETPVTTEATPETTSEETTGTLAQSSIANPGAKSGTAIETGTNSGTASHASNAGGSSEPTVFGNTTATTPAGSGTSSSSSAAEKVGIAEMGKWMDWVMGMFGFAIGPMMFF